MDKPFISFVVPLFNQVRHTQAMLESLLATLGSAFSYEIVFVDDGSTDGTREWLSTLASPVISVVTNRANIGFARSVNAGVSRARGELLAIVNNDLLFNPGWLEPMVQLLQDPQLNAGVVGNLQFRVADGALDHAGFRLSTLGKLEHLQQLAPGTLSSQRVFAVTGACMLVARAVFGAAGGFDEAFVNGGEDVDLCLKVKALGFQVYVAPESTVRHHVKISRGVNGLRDEQNSRRLFAKWRKEIKQEIVRTWLDSDVLTAAKDSVEGLTSAFLETPALVAIVLAENALQREEHRWSRLLDNVDKNEGIAARCFVSGVERRANEGLFAIFDNVLTLRLDGIGWIDGFHVSGQQRLEMPGACTQVVIAVNGLQVKSFALKDDPYFNFGIDNVMVLSGIPNVFEISFLGDAQESATPVASPCSAILLSHFVIDHKQVLPAL